jgi:hypothetical protein
MPSRMCSSPSGLPSACSSALKSARFSRGQMPRQAARVCSSAPGPKVSSSRSRTASRSIPRAASASGSILDLEGASQHASALRPRPPRYRALRALEWHHRRRRTSSTYIRWSHSKRRLARVNNADVRIPSINAVYRHFPTAGRERWRRVLMAAALTRRGTAASTRKAS